MNRRSQVAFSRARRFALLLVLFALATASSGCHRDGRMVCGVENDAGLSPIIASREFRCES